MGRKNSANISESEGEGEEELEIEEQVENKIKALPTLKEKVQAIAINSYLIEKRNLDKEMGSIVSKIQIEHRKKYAHLIDEINNIVSGQHTYTDADFQDQQVLTDEEDKAKNNYYKNEEFEEYWFKVLIQSDVTGEEVKEIDEPILKFLKRVTATKESQNNLKVVFTFAENEWFTNTVLTKEFEIDGEDIKRSFGDEINWKEGKNITVKTIKKKNKKGKKTVQKEVESFFNFFKEIDLTSDNEEEDEAEENEEQIDAEVQKLERQYEIANELYETMVPKSLEYFLGVVGADFGDMAALEGALGGDFEDDDDDEGPLAKKPKNKKSKGKAPRKGSNVSNDSK